MNGKQIDWFLSSTLHDEWKDMGLPRVRICRHSPTLGDIRESDR
jgi:hypothetical protein